MGPLSRKWAAPVERAPSALVVAGIATAGHIREAATGEGPARLLLVGPTTGAGNGP
jgi:hypothetical protein